MANVSLESFFPDIIIHVPACPEPVVTHAVRNALIEFCADTLVWQEALDAETLSATDFPYTLMAPAGAVVHNVLTVSVDGSRIEPVNTHTLDAQVQAWRAEQGAPVSYFCPDPETVSVYPLPADQVSVQLSLAYVPSRVATSVPSFLFQRYAPAIAAGALSQLLSMGKQVWGDPAAAMAASTVFGAKKLEAKVDVRKSHTTVPLSVSLRGHW